ncbi:unnamed protein product [Eruca vesicaria subsp. sativa]|uniref:Uncharacterized protein n=1 Tax=Eruca vesicaria subsp. sativa TaxID=29727 RepID=A0ABC8M421_ERUVS|nr:unnamed protein product [Eruca vesicaria subsp. sativa]
MSLDLELNLSPSRITTKIDGSSNHNQTVSSSNLTNPTTTGTGLNRSLPWLAFEGGDDDDDVDHTEQEMLISPAT